MTAPACSAVNKSGTLQQWSTAVTDRLAFELVPNGLSEAIAIRHMNPLGGGTDLHIGLLAEPSCRRQG
jgi:hypothetical protein